jgi:hypothetical protein
MCMKLDLGMHIGMQLVSSGKSGVTSTASVSTARPIVFRREAFQPARYLSARMIIDSKAAVLIL